MIHVDGWVIVAHENKILISNTRTGESMQVSKERFAQCIEQFFAKEF